MWTAGTVGVIAHPLLVADVTQRVVAEALLQTDVLPLVAPGFQVAKDIVAYGRVLAAEDRTDAPRPDMLKAAGGRIVGMGNGDAVAQRFIFTARVQQLAQVAPRVVDALYPPMIVGHVELLERPPVLGIGDGFRGVQCPLSRSTA